ncbi:branched-chain amino acid ABC transporter permease [Shimia sediminis]|uniref:branched-chain amino acid ABC transporter permease n=1 Tax=Shimia sediminis TaxID=2497945 RepID=UPI000F8DA93F|nr:branched-chain amino acid ABC transporter permease [Shimia sediminis]
MDLLAKSSPNRIGDRRKRLIPLVSLIVIVVLVGLAASQGAIVMQRRVILALIYLVAVVGLYIFVGNSGVLSFASSAFMAIGAYTTAIVTMAPNMKSTFLPDLPAFLAIQHMPPLAGIMLGGFMAALIAAVIGAPLMRLSGISAGIATLSLMVIVYIVFGNWDSVTGGQRSLMGLVGYVKLPQATLFAIGAIVIAFIYQESRGALMLRASREDPVAAAASGIRITRHRWIAFVLSAFVTGIAGALFAHLQGTVRIESFYLSLTFLLLAMLIVGGSQSLAGAVMGALALSLLGEILRQLERGVPILQFDLKIPGGLGDIVMALCLLLILMFRPLGLAGGRELTFSRNRTSGDNG